MTPYCQTKYTVKKLHIRMSTACGANYRSYNRINTNNEHGVSVYVYPIDSATCNYHFNM